MRSLRDMLDEGLGHHRAGRFAAAEGCYRAALTLDPDNAEANHLSGVLAFQAGRLAEAADRFARAVARDDSTAKYHGNLGAVLLALRRHDDALAALDRAVALDPAAPGVQGNRALALLRLDRPDRALAGAEQAVAVEPGDAAAHVTLGLALLALQRFAEAIPAFDRALALAPDNIEARSGLGYALQRSWRPDDAVARMREVVARAPESAEGWNNLGHALRHAGDLAGALEAFDRALALDDVHRAARFGRARAALLLGRWTVGWSDYLWRSLRADAATHYHRAVLPASLAGRHVAVERDQGLGDELFFLRFLPLLRQRGCRVTYLGDRRLRAMLDRAGIADRVMAYGETPDRPDCTLAVGDLPCLLGQNDGDQVPPSIALSALPASVAAADTRLAALGPPPYVGLTWRAGGGDLGGTGRKHVPPAVFGAALRGVPGTLVAVQRAPESGEIATLADAAGRPVADLTAVNEALEDALALMGRLDRYICVSNTNVHLRAAQGRRSVVLVPCPPEFRWMAEGGDSPWFPGCPIHRQGRDGDWSAALAAAAADLAAGIESAP